MTRNDTEYSYFPTDDEAVVLRESAIEMKQRLETTPRAVKSISSPRQVRWV